MTRENKSAPTPDDGSVARGNLDRWRKISVLKNKGFLAQPSNKVGFELAWINRVLPPAQNLPEVEKALFPRSVIFEIAFKKKQTENKIREALQREREALAERVKKKLSGSPDETSSGQQHVAGGEMEKREMYEAMQKKLQPPLPNEPCPSPYDEENEQDISPGPFESECHPDRVASGELGKERVDVFPIDHMCKAHHRSKDKGKLSGVDQRVIVKGKTCGEFPGNKVRLTEPWGHLRSEEFLKVGRPFKTEAVKWLECTTPPFNREEEIEAIRQRLASKYQPIITQLTTVNE